jgi:hypothetical protein
MKKLKPFEKGVSNKTFSFIVTVYNPEETTEFFRFRVVSYVENKATLAALVAGVVKYPVRVEPDDFEEKAIVAFNGISLNQLIGYLRRIVFYKIEQVEVEI